MRSFTFGVITDDHGYDEITVTARGIREAWLLITAAPHVAYVGRLIRTAATEPVAA
jgi:hypothetical protein